MSRKKPKTETLFLAVAGEAEACLFRADWDERIRNMENILKVIKWRMNHFWESWHESELDKMVREAKKVRRYVV